MTVNWDEPLVWNGQYPARLICADAKFYSGRTHVVLITREDGTEFVEWVNADGTNFGMRQRITNAPKKISGWQNIYRDDGGKTYFSRTFLSRKGADDFAGLDRIACIYVEFTEGEGLDK